MRIFCDLDDETYYVYDTGRYDENCLYQINKITGKRKAFTDVEYFKDLLFLAQMCGKLKIFDLFLQLYKRTGYDVEEEVLNWIKEESYNFGNYQELFEETFIVLYGTMIAEERKGQTLGKKIKWRGVFGIFIEELSAEDAATRDKGRKAGDILKDIRENKELLMHSFVTVFE